MIEKVVSKELMAYLTGENLLHPMQFGFRAYCSTSNSICLSMPTNWIQSWLLLILLLSVFQDKTENIIIESLYYGSTTRLNLRTIAVHYKQFSKYDFHLCDGVKTLMYADDPVLYLHIKDLEQIAAKLTFSIQKVPKSFIFYSE